MAAENQRKGGFLCEGKRHHYEKLRGLEQYDSRTCMKKKILIIRDYLRKCIDRGWGVLCDLFNERRAQTIRTEGNYGISQA